MLGYEELAALTGRSVGALRVARSKSLFHKGPMRWAGRRP
jgi:hypothetical protein